VAEVSTFKDLLWLNRKIRAIKTQQLADGLANPIGPEWASRLGLPVCARSIQVTELPENCDGELFWQVAVFFSDLRFDLRFPIRWCGSRHSGIEIAFDYARQYLPGCEIVPFLNDYWIALDARRAIFILVVPLCRK
jgi:hypothetical protein